MIRVRYYNTKDLKEFNKDYEEIGVVKNTFLRLAHNPQPPIVPMEIITDEYTSQYYSAVISKLYDIMMVIIKNRMKIIKKDLNNIKEEIK